MEFLNDIKNKNGKKLAEEAHKHTKSDITDFPKKLSQFENDLGSATGNKITIATVAPLKPSIGDMWI